MRPIAVHLLALLCFAPPVLAQPSRRPPAPQGIPGPDSPVVHPDGRVTFNLHAPEASSVAVTGDYPLRNQPMTKDEAGVWSVTVGPLREDFYAYRFTVDGVSVLDPRNIFTTRDGRRFMSWAVVPGPHSANYQVNDVPHGQVAHLWYPSPTLELTRRMTVYTPPGYEAGQERYPVLYLLHGGGGDEEAWTDMGRAPEIFDNLIAAGEMVPMIVVMGNGNVNQAAAPNRVTPNPPPPRVPGENPFADQLTRYPASIVDDMIPFVDRTFRTKADRDSRAIAGLSMGGAQTCHAAFTHLDTFSWVGMFSSAVPLLPGVRATIPEPPDAAERRGPGLGETIDPARFVERYPVVGPALIERLRLLYIGVGRADGLAEFEDDFAELFDAHGVEYTAYDLPDYGHDWSYWRLALQDFSKRLFRPPSPSR